MSEKFNTIKNSVFAGGVFIAGLFAKKISEKISGKILGEKLGEKVGEIVGNSLENLLIGVSGSLTATELDRIKFDMSSWEFRRKHPDNFKNEIFHLSKRALSLSISEEGIGNPYKDELKKQNKLTSELKDEVKREIDKLQKASKSWTFTDTDTIKYADFKNNYPNNPFEILISELELPVICESLPFHQYFKEHFAKVYQIYFGELLKEPEYNKALISYQRQVQFLLLEAINRKNSGLTDEQIKQISEQINQMASEEITNAIDEMNNSLHDRLDEIQEAINQLVKSETIEIIAFRENGLECEGRKKTISYHFKQFKEETKDFLFFKYKDRERHRIDELNEESFDYFTGTIKPNEIMVKRALINLSENKIGNAAKVYEKMIASPEGLCDEIWENCTTEIRAAFQGLLITHIDNIISIGEALGNDKVNEKNQMNYVKKCFEIIEQIVNVIVFYCIIQLFESEKKNKVFALIELAKNRYIDDKLVLLSKLLDIFSSKMNNEDKKIKEDVILGSY